MSRELIGQAQKTFFGQVLHDVFGYWRIYEWLKLRVRSQLDGYLDVASEAEFWYPILGDAFGEKPPDSYLPIMFGQPVKLRDVFLTEWVPKLPGQSWTRAGIEDLLKGKARVDIWQRFDDELYAILDPYGKEQVLSAGWGSVRLNPNISGNDGYMLLNAVTAGEWFTDRGIPVVVSAPVYREFRKLSDHGAVWAQELKGRAFVRTPPPVAVSIPTAIGAKLTPELEDALRTAPGLPQACVLVESPLDIKLKLNDSHPPIVAWAAFEMSTNSTGIGFTYTEIQPEVEEEVREGVNFIHWYAEHYGEGTVITDFDGQVRRLRRTQVRLTSDPMQNRRSRSALSRLLARIDQGQRTLRKKWHVGKGSG